jgi:hypothetical protein
MDDAAVDEDLEIVDFSRGLTEAQKDRIVPVDTVPSELINSARKAFNGPTTNGEALASETIPDPCTVYEHKDFDG